MVAEIEADVAVLGGGSAGMAAYRAATKAGARTVLIEHRAFGTTCARVGCMPSKLLIAAAEAAHARQEGAGFGLPAPAPIRWGGLDDVLARVRRERDRFVGFVLRDVEAYPPADRLLGTVHIVDDHAIDIRAPDTTRTRVRAARIVIATGSSPVMPPELAPVRGLCLTTDELFELPGLPASAAIVGTGVVALEMGQALHRLGVRVRLFGRGGRLGVLTDPELLPIALATLRAGLPWNTTRLRGSRCMQGRCTWTTSTPTEAKRRRISTAPSSPPAAHPTCIWLAPRTPPGTPRSSTSAGPSIEAPCASPGRTSSSRATPRGARRSSTKRWTTAASQDAMPRRSRRSRRACAAPP